MAYADVINPIKIKVSSDIAAKLDNFLRRMCIISAGDTSLTTGQYKEVVSSTYTTILKNATSDSELKDKLSGYFSFAGNKPCIVLEVGAFDANSNKISAQVATLKNFISSGLSRCYMHLVPDAWYFPEEIDSVRDTAFISLCNEFNGLDAATFFIVKGNNEDPLTSQAWGEYSGIKSAFVVYDNTSPSYKNPLTSIYLGIMANAKYDISDTQKCTPLNNKSIEGAKLTEIGAVLANNLTQAPQNFGGDFAGSSVLFNGRYADGNAWEFYYQNDLMIFRIQEALSSLLLNSANNGNYVLQYNQNGIDVINATIKSVLNILKSQGVITEYAAEKNASTGALERPGYINAIDFYTYKNSNPQDYASEIYGGISFYALIGRYIKQVNLAISIG